MSDDGARLEELGRSVLGPLVLGGTILPVRPFGPRLALRFAEGRTLVDLDLRSRLDVIRVRIARQLTPLDTLPDIAPAEWALVAAFNDLVQVTNHELSGPLTRGRHGRLLAMVRALCAAIPPARSPLEALCRHTITSRMPEAFRTDATLRWWTGSASFRGRPVSKRLSAWPEVRRVQIERTRVPLVRMLDGIQGISGEDFLAAVAALLARSPITDLATAGRSAPRFDWSPDTLALVASPLGRPLAARALRRAANAHAGRAAVIAAIDRLPPDDEPSRAACRAFAEEIAPREGEAALGR